MATSFNGRPGASSVLRGVAKPMRKLQDDINIPEGEREDDGFFFFDVYDSPCIQRASNDAFSITDIDNFKPCNLTFYGGCLPDESSLEAAAGPPLDDAPPEILALDVSFDYELYARRGANTTRTVAFLEGSVLEHMATAVGLDECNQGQVSDVDRAAGGRRVLNSLFTGDEAARFLGVSAAEPDVINPEEDSCFVPVTSAIASVGECVAVSGSLRAFVKNTPPLSSTDRISIQSNMLRLIRAGMKRDVYVSGNVLQSVFIGQRTTDTAVGIRDPVPDDTDRSSDGLSNQNIIIIAIVTIAMLLCFCMTAIIVGRRRKAKEEHRRRESHGAAIESDIDDSPRRIHEKPSSRITVLNDQDSDSSCSGRDASIQQSPPWLRPVSNKPVKDRLTDDEVPSPTIRPTSSLDRICDDESAGSIDWNEGRHEDDDTETD